MARPWESGRRLTCEQGSRFGSSPYEGTRCGLNGKRVIVDAGVPKIRLACSRAEKRITTLTLVVGTYTIANT